MPRLELNGIALRDPCSPVQSIPLSMSPGMQSPLRERMLTRNRLPLIASAVRNSTPILTKSPGLGACLGVIGSCKSVWFETALHA